MVFYERNFKNISLDSTFTENLTKYMQVSDHFVENIVFGSQNDTRTPGWVSS